MADEVWIQAKSSDGELLKACFLPAKGMNFISYKKGEKEIIDPSTRPLFEERYAGLGAMIGPHFHHRNPAVIPPVKHEELFPHIARLKAKGVVEPFSHGIGRYAPWKVEMINDNEIRSTLSGEDIWNGVALKELEGQNFKMGYSAKMLPQGLEIKLFVTSETESVIGLHTYYSLGGGHGSVKCRVQDHYVTASEYKPIPSTWNYAGDHTLIYPLDQETDFGFHPFPDPLNGTIVMECPTHSVHVHYQCENQENSFQLWHPRGASFVCIEPLSAKDPRKPKLTASQLKILISIL
jgi:hypothetical protein